MNGLGRDVGAEIFAQYGMDGAPITAGGAGDGVEIAWGLDKATLAERFNAVGFTLSALAILTEAETLTIDNVGIWTSVDAVNYRLVRDVGTALVLTGGPGGTNERAAAIISIPADDLDQYSEIRFTPEMSAGAGDSAVISGTTLLGWPTGA